MFTFELLKSIGLRVLAPIIIIMSILWYISHLKNQRDDAVQALATFKTNIASETIKQQADLAIKSANVQSKYDLASYINNNNINAITSHSNKTIAQITKSIKGTYETKSIKSDMVPSVGVLLKPNSDTGTNKETSSDSKGITASEPVTDTACSGLRAEKEDLELATAATTVYFNQCRSLLDADTLMYGRE